MKGFTVGFCMFAMVFSLIGVIHADDPPTVTIKQIQQYDGVSEEDRVRVEGVVIARTGRFRYTSTVISDLDGGPWGAIWVYDVDERLQAEEGQTVRVVGIVQEYYDKTELNISGEEEFPPEITGTAPVPPAIELTTGEAGNEPYECCLIRLRNVQIMGPPDTYYNVPIDDGTGEFTWYLSIHDPETHVGDVYECLSGINDYYFGEFKIRTRGDYDRVCPGEDTPTPTPTPDGQNTPTPTPTQGACYPTLELYFQNHDPVNCFVAGDMFDFKFAVANQCNSDWAVDLYIVLDVAGAYFWWPSFSQDIDHAWINVHVDERKEDNVLPPFQWPEGVGSYSGLRFIGAMTEPDTYNVVGNVPIVEFCYQ